MLTIFDPLREMTLLSIFCRMCFALVCGGAIGLEREFKRRSAGFRTHILICLGACMTTMISQFLYLYMHYFTDMARIGAQVIAGIGFIGAGAIITTPQQKVKGLTTAAGLWSSAIIGLCLGAGFYEGGIIATTLILIAELFLSKFEHRYLTKVQEVNLYLEYTNKTCLDRILTYYRENNIKVLQLEITRASETEKHKACAIFTLQLRKKHSLTGVMNAISDIEGVFLAEEI